MTSLSQHDRIRRAQQGDTNAIAELFEQYWRAARAAAYGVIGDWSLAEDAASEALFMAMKGLKTLKDPERFGPWLRTIVIRSAQRHLDTYPQSGRTGLPVDRRPDEQTPEAALEQRELADLIRQAVQILPATLREAVSLFYFEGYSIEQAAAFLDVSAGTVKRRLHDGRGRLRETAEQIVKGRKPMNPKREQVLEDLQTFLDKGGDGKELRSLMRRAWRLRPIPHDLLHKLAQKHFMPKLDTPERRAAAEQRLRKTLTHTGRLSSQALDPNHAVGRVANALRAALPEFLPWEPDPEGSVQRIIQRLSGSQDSTNQGLPPGLAEDEPCAYLYAVRGILFQDEGTVRTMYDLALNEKYHKEGEEFMKSARACDMFILQWTQTEPLALNSIEERLRALAGAVVPEKPFQFQSYEEPRYRSALRMQFNDIAVPAATGGVCEPWPGKPEGIHAGLIQLYLEAWANAQSGEVIELQDCSSWLKSLAEKSKSE